MYAVKVYKLQSLCKQKTEIYGNIYLKPYDTVVCSIIMKYSYMNGILLIYVEYDVVNIYITFSDHAMTKFFSLKVFSYTINILTWYSSTQTSHSHVCLLLILNLFLSKLTSRLQAHEHVAGNLWQTTLVRYAKLHK